MLVPFVNRLWKFSCRSAYSRFCSAAIDLRNTQERILHEIIERNRDTVFGRDHHFEGIEGWNSFRENVPIREYSQFRTWIDRIAAGDSQVLTDEKVLQFEPTSGTESGAKLIPYTQSLRAEFQEAVGAWLWDLMTHWPGIMNGRSYWSITPPARKYQETEGGIKIGFDSDSEYLGTWAQLASNIVLVVPELAPASDSVPKCLEETARCLSRTRDLRLISVWNPSFLEVLMEYLTEEPHRLWPKLQVVSCWGDGAAGRSLESLKHRFPKVTFQPKGLLSTEGVVSIPMAGREGGVLCGHCHFYEFVDHNGSVRRAHELDRGGRYEVLLTTGGGLYRYRTGDRIEILDFCDELPILRFLGRTGGVVDLRGEKLHPDFVDKVFDNSRKHLNLPRDHFAFLAPNQESNGYVLYIDSLAEVEQVANLVDELLSENPHYKLCREIGQLHPVQICLVRDGRRLMLENGSRRLGISAGDMKPIPIHGMNGWEEVFLS